MSKLSYIIQNEFSNKKIKEYLKEELKLSTRFIRGAACEGRVRVNGKRVTLRYILQSGDKIDIEVEKEENQNVEPEKMDIDVVYEDEDIIIVNKPPGIVVHPTKSYPLGTLTNGLLYYFREKGENCIVRLVSRLDMNTSGLVLIAKNQYSHMALARDMHDNPEFEKSYLAVVHGHIKDKKGTLDFPIYRDSEDSMKRIVDQRGQESVTRFEVLDDFSKGQLVKLTLETGRTHQIRVHLSHLGNPIYGDTLYGNEDDSCYIARQALHAYRLCILHPRTQGKLAFEIPLPEDMQELLSKI